MNNTARQQAQPAHFLENLISRRQLAAIIAGCRGEEGAWFRAKLAELAQTFETMHKVYAQDGKGDAAIVHLHYFTSSGDWYITERDTSVAQHQAFGSADLGYGPELGYISIAELIANGAELDLHWTPCTLGEALAVRTGDAGEVQPRLADCWTAAARRHITSRLAWLCLRLSRLLP